MCSNFIPCPLCSQPAFTNADALRVSLVSVATRHLVCPICSELLLGLDKLTIHMFGHLQPLFQENIQKISNHNQTEPNKINNTNNFNNQQFSNVEQDVNKKLMQEFSVKTGVKDNVNKSEVVNMTTAPIVNQNTIDTSVFNKPQCLYIVESTNKNDANKSMLTNFLSTLTSNAVEITPVAVNVKPNPSEEVQKTSLASPTQTNWIDNYNISKPKNVKKETEIKKVEEPSLISCDICGFQFNNEQILNMHCSLAHPTIAEQQGGTSNFPCHLCSKKFKMRGSLMVHMRVAHYGFPNLGKADGSDVNLTCGVCDKVFSKYQQLCAHLKTHDNKQWECDVCSKMFTTKYFLKKHKRLHTGEMPYQCAQCNKAFTFQQSYHKHMQYHSADKPHACPECGRAFKELSTLHNHQRIHSGERPFACETCGKCFRQRVSYLVHRRIHTGAMPYQCTACGKNFRYKVSQRTHKCPAQPPGTVVRQSGDLLQKLLQINAEKGPNGDLVVKNNNDTADIINNKLFVFEGDCKNGESGLSIEKQNDSKIIDTNENIDVIKNTDFFSLVLSPVDIPSPTDKMHNLCLSTPKEKEFKNQDSALFHENSANTNFINEHEDVLHTINEESLKQLLYGPNNN